jgi:predicted phosphoadenosine phosphosulfate sulfurtransferase
MKRYIDITVLDAAKDRISKSFDMFDKLYLSFSGGKDSTVMLHLVMNEAIKRNKKVGLLIIDLEAQYKDTIDHINKCVEMYEKHIDLHWVCAELLLRNSLSNFDPKWCCWESGKEWVRDMPSRAVDLSQYDFYLPKMEFEEFMVLFGEWYSDYGKHSTGAFIGIRADESLHRYRAIIARKENLTANGYKWTTKIANSLFNIYPIYDWKTEDVWVYLGKNKHLPSNQIYSKMNQAGVPLSNQRLCQPYGDDQKQGIWLYHILEPDTWSKLIARVSGVNSGSLYIRESGNINGNRYVEKPQGMTWQEYTNFLLRTMPKKTRKNYISKFKKFIVGWKKRGYESIPDKAPHTLEVKQWVPSWRRMARCILRNDYYCKGLGQAQPKSEAYQKFKSIQLKNRRINEIEQQKQIDNTVEIFSFQNQQHETSD